MDPERQTPKPKGLILKEARLAKKITLQTVQDATKIPLDILKAMEEGYTVRTLSPFYLKGFQKMYAHYLGVDLKELVEEVRKEEPPQPVASKAVKTVDTRQKLNDVIPRDKQRLILKSVVFFLAFFLMIKVVGCFKDRVAASRRESRTTRSRRVKKPRQITTVLPAALSPAPEKATALPGAKAEIKEAAPESKKEAPKKEEVKKEEPKKEDPKKEEIKKEELKKPEPTPAPAPAPAAKSEATAPAPAPEPVKSAKSSVVKQEKKKDVNLTVNVKKKCWLQVKVDGTVVFQANLNKDDTETWRADKTIEISGNNIENLVFDLNGKKIDPFTQKTVRRLLVTKDGISVVK